MKKIWKRSKQTTELIEQIRNAVIQAGFEEELSVVPLLNVYSVVAKKGEEVFNIRFKKDNLEMESIVNLKPVFKRDMVVKVYRNKLS